MKYHLDISFYFWIISYIFYYSTGRLAGSSTVVVPISLIIIGIDIATSTEALPFDITIFIPKSILETIVASRAKKD